uniref:FG-GAP repeat domain-containing protein n=1 Tax=Daejeonella sp. TaxID=2805397 RepID=UPI0037C04D5C
MIARKYFFLILFFVSNLLVSSLSKAQNTTNCYGPYNPTPAAAPWGVVEKFQSGAVIWNGSTPTAADLDGDGISELLATASDNSGFYIYKGNGSDKTTATKKYVIATTNERSVQPAIANIIGSASSAPEVVMVNATGFVYIFNNQGGTETNYLYKSTTASQYDNANYVNQITKSATPYIVDIDEDGTAEIVLGSDVFGIVNGALVKRVAGLALNYSSQSSGSTGTPIDVVIIDIIPSNPGKELVFGSKVYGFNLAAGTMSVLKDLSTIAGSGAAAGDNGPTAVADMDLDGDLDIVYNGSTNVYIWDPNQNLVLFKRTPPSFLFGVRGLPMIANVYNEKVNIGKAKDLPEAVIINSSSTSSGIVTAYNLNFTTATGSATQYIWSLTTNDMSGSTGITAFDFDGNGIREVVYRDQSTLRIINGNVASPVDYASISVTSATWGEYPIVGDFDNDGEADIAVTGNNMLRVFNRAPNTFAWKDAPSYWNQRNYRIVNINPDLTVPATETSIIGSASINNNVAQLQYSDAAPGSGAPYGTTAVADATITLSSVLGTCPALTIAATISNSGAATLVAGTPIAIYDANPTLGAANLVGTYVTTVAIAAGASINVSIPVNLFRKTTTVFAVVNDKGTTARPYAFSTAFPNTGIFECDYTNNMANIAVTCLDSDSDGVPDFDDIDDDNDGVLDAREQSCAQTNMSKMGISLTSTVNWSFQNAPSGLNALLDGTLIQQIYPTDVSLNGKTIFQFNLPSPKLLNLIELANNTNQTPFIAGGTYKIQGSIDGATNWVDIVSSQVVANTAPILATTNSIKFDMSNNGSKYLSYRIVGISITGQANWAQEAYLGELVCTDIDTDSDGKPNRLDLDSDADGCSDAKEAGTTTSLTANYAFTSAVGTNGLANVLETSADNGIINYVSTYADNALVRTVNACIDTDSDGITDLIDIDDDNDGVLDLEECPFEPYKILFAGSSEDFNGIRSNLFADFNNGKNLVSTIVQSNIIETATVPPGFYDGYDLVIFGGVGLATIHQNHWDALKLAILNKTSTSFVIQAENCCVATNRTNLISLLNEVYGTSYTSTGASTGAVENVLFKNPLNAYASVFPAETIAGADYFGINGMAPSDVLYYANNSTTTAYAGMKKLPGTNENNRFLAWFTDGSFTATARYATNQGKIGSAFFEAYKKSFSTSISCNPDLDTVPNHLDFDSDGDGCSDAKEAGATALTTANYTFTSAMGTNGLADVLETTADNGTVKYNVTYDANALNNTVNACIDTDSDGITDLLDIDDDNDGVLDIDEVEPCRSTFNFSSISTTPQTVALGAGLLVTQVSTVATVAGSDNYG